MRYKNPPIHQNQDYLDHCHNNTSLSMNYHRNYQHQSNMEVPLHTPAQSAKIAFGILIEMSPQDTNPFSFAIQSPAQLPQESNSNPLLHFHNNQLK